MSVLAVLGAGFICSLMIKRLRQLCCEVVAMHDIAGCRRDAGLAKVLGAARFVVDSRLEWG